MTTITETPTVTIGQRYNHPSLSGPALCVALREGSGYWMALVTDGLLTNERPGWALSSSSSRDAAERDVAVATMRQAGFSDHDIDRARCYWLPGGSATPAEAAPAEAAPATPEVEPTPAPVPLTRQTAAAVVPGQMLVALNDVDGRIVTGRNYLVLAKDGREWASLLTPHAGYRANGETNDGWYHDVTSMQRVMFDRLGLVAEGNLSGGNRLHGWNSYLIGNFALLTETPTTEQLRESYPGYTFVAQPPPPVRVELPDGKVIHPEVIEFKRHLRDVIARGAQRLGYDQQWVDKLVEEFGLDDVAIRTRTTHQVKVTWDQVIRHDAVLNVDAYDEAEALTLAREVAGSAYVEGAPVISVDCDDMPYDDDTEEYLISFERSRDEDTDVRTTTTISVDIVR